MEKRLLIVDDDPIAGSLAFDLLNEAGFEAELLNQSLRALDTIKRKGYRLVLLDILMPGIDGITLCHDIKNDPQTSSVKVIVVSGKSFKADIDNALAQGADLFIEKPYSVEGLPEQVKKIAESLEEEAAPAASPDNSGLTSNANPVLDVTVWGGRSISEIPPLTVSRYGWRTPCISMEAGNRLFIFDAGSGLAPLEEEIIRAGRHKDLWIFLTHFHKAHIEGLRSSRCARLPQFRLNISAASEPGRNLSEMVQNAFVESEKDLESIEAGIEIFQVMENAYEIAPGVNILPFYANHPGRTLGYTLQTGGRKIVYCPDDELYGESATSLQDFDERLSKICAGADLLIHDGRYKEEEYLKCKNNGHSSFLSAVNLAGRSDVKRLILMHQDEQYSDDDLDAMSEEVARVIAQEGYSLQCVLAREGLKVAI
jgi:CheY-like chemotaxis protein/ribonuclease BN (tRNA processing enzyme)